jgi:phage terminase Nu1 subunit (DNA packaging protein)
VILSGWKAIAEYMGSGVRTVQRWERKGLPVNRPAPGLRSHVVAHSEQIDHWIEDRAARSRGADSDLLNNIATALKLRHEVKRAREELHQKMAALRKELAALRAKRRHTF